MEYNIFYYLNYMQRHIMGLGSRNFKSLLHKVHDSLLLTDMFKVTHNIHVEQTSVVLTINHFLLSKRKLQIAFTLMRHLFPVDA